MNVHIKWWVPRLKGRRCDTLLLSGKKNVQGTKNEIIKKKFISLIPQTHEPDTATNHQATACHQDGSEQV